MKVLIQKVVDTYGAYAFGLVTILLMWVIIVRPELNARSFNFSAQQEIVASLKQQSISAQATAVILERAIDKVELLADKVRDIQTALDQNRHDIKSLEAKMPQ